LRPPEQGGFRSGKTYGAAGASALAHAELMDICRLLHCRRRMLVCTRGMLTDSQRMLDCVFRSDVTARFGNVTGHFGDRDRSRISAHRDR
jgi:hypothetical protein